MFKLIEKMSDRLERVEEENRQLRQQNPTTINNNTTNKNSNINIGTVVANSTTDLISNIPSL